MRGDNVFGGGRERRLADSNAIRADWAEVPWVGSLTGRRKVWSTAGRTCASGSRRRWSATNPVKELTVPNRERMDRGAADRFIRRDAKGRFTSDQVDVGRSLAADRRTNAKTVVPKGQGDRGDQRRASKG